MIWNVSGLKVFRFGTSTGESTSIYMLCYCARYMISRRCILYQGRVRQEAKVALSVCMALRVAGLTTQRNRYTWDIDGGFPRHTHTERWSVSLMAPRETGSAPKHYRGQEIYEDVQKISTVAGKRKRDTPTSDAQTQIWKKNSILWELPYWKDLDVHHCIDVMHIEKNVCDALLGTLLNMKGRSKDHRNARKDLQERGLRPELVPEGDDEDLPTSCVTLSKKEKKGLCEFFQACF